VTIPVALRVISSPLRVHIIIELRDTSVIHPPTVIIPGSIPPAFPRTPPPTVPEKQIYVEVRNNIDIICIRKYYNIWRHGKCNRWW